MKYQYFKFIFVPISNKLGTKHTREFKAIDYEHALKQAKREEKFCVKGKQVYKLLEETK